MTRSSVLLAAGNALLGLSLTACVGMAPSKLKQRPFYPLGATPEHIALPALNTEAVAQVGDTMIEGGNVYRRPAIRLLSPVVHHGISKADYTIWIPESDLVASGTAAPGSAGGTFFEAPQPLRFKSLGMAQVRGGIFLPESPSATPEIYWHATDTGVPLVDPDLSIRVERTTHEDWQTDSFRRELVYNGRSGATIKLLYREFSEERIRPAFSQEVTYDLQAGQTIGFKGARFQVVDADNIRIKYVVLHHFD